MSQDIHLAHLTKDSFQIQVRPPEGTSGKAQVMLKVSPV